jgi:hypothetical protein
MATTEQKLVNQFMKAPRQENSRSSSCIQGFSRNHHVSASWNQPIPFNCMRQETVQLSKARELMEETFTGVAKYKQEQRK